MKYITVIAVYLALNVTCAQLVVAEDQTQAESTAGTEATGDELHFVTVLPFQGEIVAVDPTKRLITLKGSKGEVLILEALSEEDLAARKVSDHVHVRYFEGAQIRKRERGEAVPVQSLKDGMISEELGEPSGKERALSASVERIDALNQEITLKGLDGSLETIMVSNPEYLSHIKVGDRAVIMHPQGLALSIERES
jgi:hypothetical protein